MMDSTWREVVLTKWTIQDDILAHPHRTAFEYFVRCNEEIPRWMAAAAQASLNTGKRINLVLPAIVTQEGNDDEDSSKAAHVLAQVP